ncbi:UNVERIFIED_CONTAM: hypothetical protein Cloal_3275 [Acetivibrio alkalicellulosi]
MKKSCKILILMLFMLIILMIPITVWSNAAEPPSVVILINNPPKDLSIVLLSNDKQPEARVQQVAWEGYYAFYSPDIQGDSEYTFKVISNDESFELTIDAPLLRYNNVFTLDLARRELIPGKYPFRSVILISIRLLLTLLLEGLIFWLFRFKEKKSWIIFLAINILTQGTLNIWLNRGNALMPSYLIISLIIGEFFVFVAEIISFPIFIKEHKKFRILIYVLIANLISLIAGGYIISVLPV